MKRIKTEVLVLGNGAAALFAANRLFSMGIDAVFVNPFDHYSIKDLSPFSGLGLWDAAYRSEASKESSLADLYEELEERLMEIFPAAIENTGLKKTSHWSVLSSTPVHRQASDFFEKNFFRHDKKKWSGGQIRLVNKDNFNLSSKKLGLQFQKVSQLEAGIHRNYGLSWDSTQMGYYLQHFVKNKKEQDNASHWFEGVNIRGRYGRKLVIESPKYGEVSIDSEQAILVFFTGEILPKIKNIVSSCEEPWIQGVRKRRVESHWIYFDPKISYSDEGPVWFEIGELNYYFSKEKNMVSWRVQKGPDGFEKAVDEALRVQSARNAQLSHWDRSFVLDWDWKSPQWRKTSHDTYWATSFEGDIWNITELVWNLPCL